jgi:hypothetical protein
MARQKFFAALSAISIVTVAALTAAAGPAAASGPSLTVTPSTNLNDQNIVHVALTGADSYNGQTVYFAECNQAQATTDGNANFACDQSKPVAVSNGSAHTTQLITSDAKCSVSNNGDCVAAVLLGNNSGYSFLATTPITFGTPTATATPTTNLADQQAIQVNVTGVEAGDTIYVDECSSGASDFDPTSATCNGAGYGTTTDAGLSLSVNVKYGAINNARCDETTPAGHCELVVRDEMPYGYEPIITSIPISFGTPTTTYTVGPKVDGLANGDTMSVSGSAIPTEDAPSYVAECNTTYASAHGG